MGTQSCSALCLLSTAEFVKLSGQTFGLEDVQLITATPDSFIGSQFITAVKHGRHVHTVLVSPSSNPPDKVAVHLRVHFRCELNITCVPIRCCAVLLVESGARWCFHVRVLDQVNEHRLTAQQQYASLGV